MTSMWILKFSVNIYIVAIRLLMNIPQQVVHSLHWIECHKRHLDENRIPVTHRAIPQARELHSLKFTSVL